MQTSFNARLKTLKINMTHLQRQFTDESAGQLSSVEPEYLELLKQKEVFWR